jgi:hypothetical protein
MANVRPETFFRDPAALAAYHEREAAKAHARSIGRKVLHRPYCSCESTWTEEFTDAGCELL